jgi:uncharacterized Zn finger protein
VFVSPTLPIEAFERRFLLGAGAKTRVESTAPAAALYGVGARLDQKPQLLFVLRGVDENELIAGAGQDLTLTKAAPSAAKMLDDGDVAALFGLEMAEPADRPALTASKPSRQSKSGTAIMTAAGKKALATPKNKSRATRTKSGQKPTTLVGAKKRPAQPRPLHSA